MLHIKKNDEVVVIAGKDKSKTGKVIRVFHDTQKVLVENVNIIKKTIKKTQENQQGGIIEIEAPIHLSNIMLLDKKMKKPTRYGVSVSKDGSKVRVSKKSGEVI